MKDSTSTYFNELFDLCPNLNACKEEILKAYHALYKCFSSDKMLLICGNGGSAADSDHIAGELAKGFALKRPISNNLKIELCMNGDRNGELGDKLQCGLKALNLAAQTSLCTAIGNDMGYDFVFAQQVIAFGRSGDVLIGISTSGNSSNVLNAGITAKAQRLTTIGLTGKDGGAMKDIYDVVIQVPDEKTYHIQELHMRIYHTLCLMLERELFDGE